MIVDCHTHIFPLNIIKDRETFCSRDAGFSSIYRDPKAKLTGAGELIAAMDQAGIAQSVICGFSWKEPDLCAIHNRYLLESASTYAGRLIVFITLPLSHADWAVRELEQGIEAGARGVGEIAFYDREMTSGDLDAMIPFLTLMEHSGMPLLIHTNETLGHAYPGKGKTPVERFYELIRLHPRLSVILAHWGGGLPFYELMPEVSRTMARVYYDTAASPLLYSKKIYRIVCGIVGSERILFGTDFPLLSASRYFAALKDSGLTEEEQANILGGNFLRLLRPEKLQDL